MSHDSIKDTTTPQAQPATQAQPLAYVKSVATADLPEEIRAHMGNKSRVYALHSEAGEPLAIVPEYKMAHIVAKQNDYHSVAVH